MNMLENFYDILLFCTIPGTLGGAVGFFLGLRQGAVRNSNYIRKAVLEINGTMIATTLFPIAIGGHFHELAMLLPSFAIGLSWSKMVQMLREKITKTVIESIEKSE